MTQGENIDISLTEHEEIVERLKTFFEDEELYLRLKPICPKCFSDTCFPSRAKDAKSFLPWLTNILKIQGSNR